MPRRLWVLCLAALAVGFVIPAAATRTAARTSVSRSASVGKIKHIIVMYQENRSFDEVLGAFCIAHHRCNGSIGPVRLKDGSIQPLTKSPDVVSPDPPHGIVTQERAMDGGRMDGWGEIGAYCHSPGKNPCLSYYEPSQVPSLTALAGKYVVSDRTFSMQDSPSYGGHLYAVAATQDGFDGDTPTGTDLFWQGWGCDSPGKARWKSPQGVWSTQPSCVPAPPGYLNPAQYPYGGASGPTQVRSVPTIMDRLDSAHLSWKLYGSIKIWNICPQFAKCLYGPQHTHVVAPATILDDAKHGTLPAFSILLPSGPGGGSGGTGQHPPSSMLAGDNWIGQVAKALQASPEWSSTALFITYDDCGCFYDHVTPGHNPDGTQQGIREPMVIVSPYAKRAGTDSHAATFASILRFAEETFGLAPLSVNDARAYDYANAFNFSAPPSGPRVWPKEQPIPESTLRLLASLPRDDNDPT